MSEETLVEHIGQLQITIKPPTAKREEPQTAKSQTQQQITPPAAESVTPTQEPGGETEPENPEYTVTKGIIRKLLKEIAASRKKLKTQQQQQDKGSHNLILAESLEDEEELAATSLDIIEDVTANKVPVETQFQ